MSAAAADKIERALLAGDPNTDSEPCGVTGLLTQSSSFQTLAFGTESDLGEDIRRALRLIRAENFDPTAILLHSTAWDGLLAIRTQDDQLKYPSVAAASPSIWGLPLVIGNAVPTSAVTDGVESSILIADWSKVLIATMPMSILVSNVATVGGISNFEADRTSLRWYGNVSSPLIRTPHLGSMCIIENVVA